MAKDSNALLEFKVKLPKLSKSQKKALGFLVEAGRLVAPLYKLQENPEYPGANFYPADATKEEIEKAAKKNPQILSPFTVIERRKGKLMAIPYHKKYAGLINPIAEKLKKAAGLIENKEFAGYVKVLSEALVKGNYEEAIAARLRTKPYILDISIGPMDYLDDQLFFAKASYQGWVGVLDKEGTDRLNNYKSIVLGVKRKAAIPSERINNLGKVKAQVDDVVLVSGLLARTKFVGESLPYDLNVVGKYGSEITLFNQFNDLRLREQIIPTFNKIFPKQFKQGYNPEDTRRGYLRAVALHELAHSYLRYKHAAANLKDLFFIIDELAATVLGLRMAGALLLKERINEKQLESMIVAFICRSYSLLDESKKNRFILNFAFGDTIFINYMVKQGALKKKGSFIIPNFIKIFVALQELFVVLEDLLSHGSREEAGRFIKDYS